MTLSVIESASPNNSYEVDEDYAAAPRTPLKLGVMFERKRNNEKYLLRNMSGLIVIKSCLGERRKFCQRCYIGQNEFKLGRGNAAGLRKRQTRGNDSKDYNSSESTVAAPQTSSDKCGCIIKRRADGCDRRQEDITSKGRRFNRRSRQQVALR